MAGDDPGPPSELSCPKCGTRSDYPTPGQASALMVTYHTSHALRQVPVFNPPFCQISTISYPKRESDWLSGQHIPHGHEVTKLQSSNPTLGPGLLKPVHSFLRDEVRV